MMAPQPCPAAAGFYMPAEFAPHDGTILIWPVRPGSWGLDPRPAQRAFADVIRAIAPHEQVILIVDEAHADEARAAVGDLVDLYIFPTEDSWARDSGPTFVTDGHTVRGISWQFNAWGGTFDGLYTHWENDDALAGRICDALQLDCYDLGDFVLEGGSIHTDGEGTLLVTEACLLSRGRNPDLSREQIEARLEAALGIEKVLWLPRGIYNDETNEHVDNMCAFLAPGEVVLAWTDRSDDPQYALSQQTLAYLSQVTDAKGRPLLIHKLPIPDNPITITADDLQSYHFESGEDARTIGERMAASYVNFYFANQAVIVPQFGGGNAASDERAIQLLTKLCPDRQVVGIDARAILLGGGNIHCITQQIPKGGLSK